jgi:Na+/H+ antiporter NhaC
MFGDNLSMISDTTIAATRTQGIEMREKFLANLGIALPAALVALVVYGILGKSAALATAPYITARQIVLVLPYILILALALAGMNVMLLLFLGTVVAALLGGIAGHLGFWDALKAMGDGSLGMAETLFVALLAGGLLGTIRENGGIAWLIQKIERLANGPRGCEFGVLLLVAAVNLFTANNTVAIVIAGPIAKDLSDRFRCLPRRIASILDTTSCVVQGAIPYGAQILIATGLAKEAGCEVSPLGLVANLYYPFLLGIAVLVSIAAFARARDA